MATLPKIPQAVRDRARVLYRELGPAQFHAALAARDPVAAARIGAGDRQRMIRAFEVIEATGRSLIAWQEESPGTPSDLGFAAILLDPPRAALYGAIERRFDGMIAKDALDEVRALKDMNLDPHLPALRAVGVPELGRHLAGELGREDAVALAKQSSRRFAKRQVTWFRHQTLGSRLLTVADSLDKQFSERLTPNIYSFIACSF